MRTSFLYAGCALLMLASVPALAQDAISDASPDEITTEMLSDPMPMAKPLYPPSAATGGSAVESPPASSAGVMVARQTRMLPCTALNPCAVSSPLPPAPKS